LLKRRRLAVFRKAKKDLIAASVTFRVSGAFWRASSRCSKKAQTNSESGCSSMSDGGATLSLAAANSNNSWKL
jgi:hypothetical protein